MTGSLLATKSTQLRLGPIVVALAQVVHVDLDPRVERRVVVGLGRLALGGETSGRDDAQAGGDGEAGACSLNDAVVLARIPLDTEPVVQSVCHALAP